ncbi:hypothetical protein J4417_04870 [Candidatus Woesearchaeota archaeon]|nr:hypothetical protein [Candidatus Woesearchaeota archaeon]
MPKKTIAELKKLPPEERLVQLKKLEEKRKKEIETAQKLMQESEKELKTTRELEEKISIPRIAASGGEEFLQSEEERQIFRVVRGDMRKKGELEKEDKPKKEKSLEEDLEQVSLKQKEGEAARADYVNRMSQRPIGDLYQEMSGLRRDAEERGYVTPEHMRRIGYLNEAAQQKMDDIRVGRYQPGEEGLRETTLIQKVGDSLQRLYQSGKGERAKHGGEGNGVEYQSGSY